ncbi:hypothetical protein HWB99_gp099 [Mycobacterium phage DrLupo]|uniref:Uncharacterized protein n=1 Tax=Mycobacterium phage DrLupo TaxID=2499037 RepID=A0A3S9UQR0_9CAUD|nr:hypothetical protein HWB99_gp099 [Mycobacterium phage DrLupo]AZS12635.1 hypothetical protein SEA_DRLUPO_99 [Mycobacterium phage DrLupo]
MNVQLGPIDDPDVPWPPATSGQVVTLPEEGLSAEQIRAYCVEQGRRIARDRQGLDVAYETYKDSDPAKAHEFERVDWLRQGEQIALRNLLEYFGLNHK